MRLILILTPHQDQLLVSLVNQFTFISLVILADVLSCRGVVHLASRFLLLSSGKVSQMAALTERPQEWHIHMTTSHTAYQQKMDVLTYQSWVQCILGPYLPASGSALYSFTQQQHHYFEPS
jgi:hypothetical protein